DRGTPRVRPVRPRARAPRRPAGAPAGVGHPPAHRTRAGVLPHRLRDHRQCWLDVGHHPAPRPDDAHPLAATAVVMAGRHAAGAAARGHRPDARPPERRSRVRRPARPPPVLELLPAGGAPPPRPPSPPPPPRPPPP